MTETRRPSQFPAMEEEVLDFWRQNNIFKASIDKHTPHYGHPSQEGNSTPSYVFYDGPPFATGTPHYGHIVASLIKDAVPRYWTMKGYRVERKWGWDCHGLPIENIIEKELGTKSKKDILDYGVERFNDACRARVLDYANEWEKTIERLGRWVDMKNAYKTMDLDYMESVWWVFKQLYDKGLIYEGYRSMHVCPRCETTLSQSEVAEGYKDIKDLSAIAKFKLNDPTSVLPLERGGSASENVYVLAWTTTPWTLIGNVALAINSEVIYCKVKTQNLELKTETTDSTEVVYYIVAKERVADVFKDKEFEIVGEIKGSDLVGLKYEPLFDYYAQDETLKNRENGWQIYGADFVTTEDGTGVVHIAPAFGEDDLNLGKLHNLPFVQHVGMDGIIKAEAKDLAGLSVKPSGDHMTTDIEIIKYLAGKGLLFHKEKYEHSYPHCWRCDTPLLNYATGSWFVSVTKIKEKCLETAEQINWSPEHIKSGRFGQWLAGARDWSISRQRFWASCLPIWKCQQCNEIKVFGSVAELQTASGTEITDLHKDKMDLVSVPCVCSARMQRIPDVLDCWFESGSMPYAQMHYPFENKEKMEANFPAQFIAEGVDQTRAWFYYLHVIANGINNVNAFKNVIVNGIVLAEDGKKMSKKLKNYPDPNEIVNAYGADALRMYLLSSPVMQAENLSFSEAGVQESLRKNVMTLWNVYKFYETYAGEVSTKEIKTEISSNVLDLWIQARLQQLINEVSQGLENYDLPRASRPVTAFIDDFSTWYLRRSRDRFKTEEKTVVVLVMKEVLERLAKVMAPMMPFIAETLWQKVSGNNFQNSEQSVHLTAWPETLVFDEVILADMTAVRKIVEIGLSKRDEHKVKIRQPLNKFTVYNTNIKSEFYDIITDELNVKEFECVPGEGDLSGELDLTMTRELEMEGAKRELVRAVNALRKEAGLTIQDRVVIYCLETDNWIETVVEQYQVQLCEDTLSTAWLTSEVTGELLISKELKINDHGVKVLITK